MMVKSRRKIMHGANCVIEMPKITKMIHSQIPSFRESKIPGFIQLIFKTTSVK